SREHPFEVIDNQAVEEWQLGTEVRSAADGPMQIPEANGNKQRAARAQNAPGERKRSLRVLQRPENIPDGDDVRAFVFEPGVVHRRVDEIDIKTALLCFGTGKTEHGAGAIDPANTVAEFRQQDGACPGAASEIDGISCLHSQSGGEDAPPLIPVAQ